MVEHERESSLSPVQSPIGVSGLEGGYQGNGSTVSALRAHTPPPGSASTSRPSDSIPTPTSTSASRSFDPISTPSSSRPLDMSSRSETMSSSRPSDLQRHAKPKRLKAHTVTSKSFSIPTVPRDKSGRPLLPLNVGIMTVLNLGDVCMREHFHTERYIFPVGYEVTRRYLSTVDPTQEVVYQCSILDGGDGPKFQLVPSDAPERPVIAGTATGAWSSIVKQANAIRNRQHSNSVSGPDFFGLGQNTIKHLIQELPGADRLRDYVWQNFVEGGPLGGRHAAVIPALPEDYDAATNGGSTPGPPASAAHGYIDSHNYSDAHPPYPDGQFSQQSHYADAQVHPNYADAHVEDRLTPPYHLLPPQAHPHGQAQTIVLPPPTAETLNIHEYHHPPASTKERAHGHGYGKGKEDAHIHGHGHDTRSRRAYTPQPQHHHQAQHSHPQPQHPYQTPSQQSQQHSPYLSNTEPVPVPATFASIMNAYPAPGPPSGPGSSPVIHTSAPSRGRQTGSEDSREEVESVVE
ncbi:hypothetical protein SERLA73DRAFT_97431 [Serpula lacrymans var. lacrymans S7.3]|uniref:FYR N-terminal domain-containing protein n=2 Tax=Serpula lacrymans var. lacrymans TaxID=341189 RepID=F8QD30_SERL3|nr:uncharacterized protein SERLADRAFT_479932 [Serpula lacrymans var. lacrymans S7.9]EGN94045.1 hypothetical protein SERLA73DRAFT_97431 [Serpula lacrymans var. lacrymans S7.3]EGO19394.1 hypothetical protein SERLADRAFT_479932 [Serpula lacrymans var. lacrymans S7.9]